MPYIDGCLSISATGRYEPASFIFKPAMLSQCVLLVFYWVNCVVWLHTTDPNRRPAKTQAFYIRFFGFMGALALVLYVAFLGTQAPFYEFMRRIGIYFYFLCTVIAQILLATATIKIARVGALARILKIGRSQLMLYLIPIGLGVLNLILKSTLENPDPAENIIEWIVAFLMQAYFLLTFFVWHNTRFEANFFMKLK